MYYSQTIPMWNHKKLLQVKQISNYVAEMDWRVYFPGEINSQEQYIQFYAHKCWFNLSQNILPNNNSGYGQKILGYDKLFYCTVQVMPFP